MTQPFKTFEQFKDELPKTFNIFDSKFSWWDWLWKDNDALRARYENHFFQPKFDGVIDDGLIKKVKYTPTKGKPLSIFFKHCEVDYEFEFTSDFKTFEEFRNELPKTFNVFDHKISWWDYVFKNINSEYESYRYNFFQPKVDVVTDDGLIKKIHYTANRGSLASFFSLLRYKVHYEIDVISETPIATAISDSTTALVDASVPDTSAESIEPVSHLTVLPPLIDA